ncbi:hypothetical protein LRP88_10388 [Fusarium phalaenopsidis]|nr:hypothetical protein NCS56_00548200 [Fusarium sp. Ph1]
MRDDERYPTVVDPPPDHSLPEVVTGTQVDPHGRDKVVSDIQDPGMIPTYDDAQKEVAGGEKETKDMAGAAGVGTRGGEAADSIDKGPRRIFGMKRRKFLIVLAAIMFMLVAAAVGGTVGGIHANKGDDNGKEDGGGGGGGGDGGDGNDDSTPTTTDTGPVPRKTGPIDADERFLAAVVAADDDDENFQVFYNDLNTTNILYRRMHDDDGGAEHTLDLDIEPNYGTPLAATLRLASSIMTTQLFYVTTEDNETQIAQVTLNCGNLNADDDDGDDDNDDDGEDDDDDNQAGGTANSGTAACAVASNSIISTNLTNGVHPDSKLAALRLGNDSTRVYFQASGTNIWALNGDDADAEGWVGSNLMGGVRPGSSIAATRSNATDIHVFFVANSTGWMRTFNYADVLGSDDSQVVDDQPGSSWRASVFFDATYIPSLNSYRVFYTNPSSGTIVSYLRNGAQADWTSNNDNARGRPASGITAVGWQDNVRLFYYQSGRLTMSANDGDDWDDAEPVA